VIQRYFIPSLGHNKDFLLRLKQGFVGYVQVKKMLFIYKKIAIVFSIVAIRIGDFRTIRIKVSCVTRMMRMRCIFISRLKLI